MKPKDFPLNDRGLFVQFMRMREGPDYFLFSYKNSSRLIKAKEPKDVWRCLGTAKYTDTGKALKEWAVEMVEATLPKPEPRADTSFASEALEEAPNSNTKMIT